MLWKVLPCNSKASKLLSLALLLTFDTRSVLLAKHLKCSTQPAASVSGTCKMQQLRQCHLGSQHFQTQGEGCRERERKYICMYIRHAHS